MLKRILLTLLIASAPIQAGATDYTDIWWNPAESGWGINLVQNANFIFATFFIYGPDNAPTWVTGQMTQDATGNFAGGLYASAGPWFGTDPYNPATVTRTQVGNVTFAPIAADAGVLTYNVANVQVIKNIQRIALVPIPLAGNYIGGVFDSLSGCSNPASNASGSTPATFVITQNGGQTQLTLELAAFSCSFAGTATQRGQLTNYPATYTCSDGFVGTAVVSELRATSFGMEGRWTAPAGGGCQENGTFAGVRN